MKPSSLIRYVNSWLEPQDVLNLNRIVHFTDSSGSQGTSLRMDSQDSTEVEWGSSRQPSISLREWDIPIEDLKIGQKIGSGQFSTGNCN